MKKEVQKYLDIRKKITTNKFKLINNTDKIKGILVSIKKLDSKTLDELMNIYEIEKGNVLLDEDNKDLELKLINLKLKYFDKYNEPISLVEEVKNYEDNLEYKDYYLDYFKLCDKVICMLNDKNDERTFKIINSLNSSISRRIIDESERSGKDIYFYIEERKKYQELNNML